MLSAEEIIKKIDSGNYYLQEINSSIANLTETDKQKIREDYQIGLIYLTHVLKKTSSLNEELKNACSILDERTLIRNFPDIVKYQEKENLYGIAPKLKETFIEIVVNPIMDRLKAFLSANYNKNLAQELFETLILDYNSNQNQLLLFLINQYKLTLVDFQEKCLMPFYHAVYDTLMQNPSDGNIMSNIYKKMRDSYLESKFYKTVLSICLMDKNTFETFLNLNQLDKDKNQWSYGKDLDVQNLTHDQQQLIKKMEDFEVSKQMFLEELLSNFNISFDLNREHKTIKKIQYNAVTWSVANNQYSLAETLNKKYNISFDGSFSSFQERHTYKTNRIGRPNFVTENFILPHTFNLLAKNNQSKAHELLSQISPYDFDLNIVDQKERNFLFSCVENHFYQGLDYVEQVIRKQSKFVHLLEKEANYNVKFNRGTYNIFQRMIILNISPDYFEKFMQLYIDTQPIKLADTYNYSHVSCKSLIIEILENINNNKDIINNFKYLDILIKLYPQQEKEFKQTFVKYLSLNSITEEFLEQFEKRNFDHFNIDENLIINVFKNNKSFFKDSTDLLFSKKFELVYDYLKSHGVDYKTDFNNPYTKKMEGGNIFFSALVQSNSDYLKYILKDIQKEKNTMFLNTPFIYCNDKKTLPLSMLITHQSGNLNCLEFIISEVCFAKNALEKPVGNYLHKTATELISIFEDPPNKNEKNEQLLKSFVPVYKNLITMIELGANINQESENLNPFFSLVNQGSIDLLKNLEQYSIDYHQHFKNGKELFSALHFATDMETIDYLVQEKNVQITNDDQMVLIKEIQTILDDKDIKDKNQWIAIHKLIKLSPLMDKLNTYKSEDGDNLLHLAVKNNNLMMFNILLHAGVDVNAINSQGKTPFHYLLGKALMFNGYYGDIHKDYRFGVFSGQEKVNFTQIIQLALNKGASLDIKSKSGLTPEKLFSGKLKSWITNQSPELQMALLQKQFQNSSVKRKSIL